MRGEKNVFTFHFETTHLIGFKKRKKIPFQTRKIITKEKRNTYIPFHSLCQNGSTTKIFASNLTRRKKS